MPHTPSKWVQGPDDDTTAFPGALRVFHEGTRTHVCSRVREEDAPLIVAAPDLLASLEELSEWMRWHCTIKDGTHEMLVRACERILAAGGTIK